jgi:PBSX family phage terminase large subunit
MAKPLTAKEALITKHELWRRGELSWKMHSGQKEMYQLYKDAKPNSSLVWLISRRFGKSYTIAILALQEAIRNKNAVVKIVTDTKVHAKSIFEPLFRDILEDCPDDIKPEYLQSQYQYTFRNGSQIQLAGSDGGHYERLRGQQSTAVFVDEAGFCDRLEDVVKSVLLPTMLHTGGKIVLASTPPSDPDHEFFQFIEKAELEGLLSKKTIYENPLLSKEQIDVVIKEMGGVNNPKFQREYLCIPTREDNVVVFPEFDEHLQKLIIKEHPKPPMYDTYVGMDLGYKDLTAVVFLYYDFRSDKIIVEDEIVIPGKDLHLDRLTAAILQKEEKLWTNIYTGEICKPKKRVSDINYIVTQEINKLANYQLHFHPANKQDSGTSVNNLRTLLANGKIIISPRCVNLIRHLKNCKWQNSNEKSGFARSPDDGHYDAVDALKYAVKEINFNKNPYLNNAGGMSIQQLNGGGSMTLMNPSVSTTKYDPLEVYKKVFGRRK